MKIKVFIALLVNILLTYNGISIAASRYVRSGAIGSNNGSDWNNAYTDLPATLTRGDTYYMADGNYAGRTFSTPASGASVITIKKATVADHGTDTGWSNSYGIGQAVFGAISFTTSYWTLDGNGTHTVPSNNTNDYGIKISTNLTSGATIQAYNANVSYLTLRYVHSYNAGQGGNCSYNGSHRNFNMYTGSYVKLQNCYFQNSFQDGVMIQAVSNVLLERNYFEGLGLEPACSPDYHGQAIRLWGPASNYVVRWNIMKDNDGQGVLAFAYDITNNRVYGNVLFNAHKDGPLFIGNNGGMWDFYAGTMTNSYIYNNTFANAGGVYPGFNFQFPVIYDHGTLSGDRVVYNNLYFNIATTVTMVSSTFSPHSNDAYGNSSSTSGGTNSQSGITSNYFVAYDETALNFDFRLRQNTNVGKNLTAEPWWNAASDSFFGQLDSAVDMYGNTRGADGIWDRGAFEYVNTGNPTLIPVPPSNLIIN